MTISENSKKALIEEIDFAAKKMEEEKDASIKLYYFSAIFGALNRILNSEFNEDILFSHFVFRAAYDSFQVRLAQIKNNDATVPLYEAHFNGLISLSREYAKKMKKGIDATDVLKKMAVLIYSTTGNGFYLLQRGLYKI
jgi:hypothetical protein